jgi:NAD(P)-dependent dehydrogenase (short-subunit alcohol dehydrogenase family)
MNNKSVALVTGANKGIGLEIAKQLATRGYVVLLAARDRSRGEAAAKEVRANAHDVRAITLDVADAVSIAALPRAIEESEGRLDVLVNNAGVFLDMGTMPGSLDLTKLRQTFDTNFFGAVAVTQAVLPLLKRSPAGRIVNLSSTLGSLTMTARPNFGLNGIGLAYQASKTALNMFTVLLAKELKDTTIKVNSVCPGWVRTDMGSAAAPLSVEQGADTPVWLATLPADGPTGGFFHARKPMAW